VSPHTQLLTARYEHGHDHVVGNSKCSRVSAICHHSMVACHQSTPKAQHPNGMLQPLRRKTFRCGTVAACCSLLRLRHMVQFLHV